MKDTVRVSLIQFAPAWLKPEENAKRMANFVEEEAKQGSELIVFPELSNVGYITPIAPGLPASYADGVSAQEFAIIYVKAAEKVPGPTSDLLLEAARKHGVYIVVGVSRLHPVIPAVIYNTALLIGPSGLIGMYDKVHLPSNEKHFFHPGNSIDVYQTDLGNIGMCICYDGRFPEWTRILSLKGAEIVCTIYNIPKVRNSLEAGTIKTRASTRALENSNYNLACNRAGIEGSSTFLGESTITGPTGAILACLDSEEEGVISAELFNDEIVRVRASGLTVFQDRRPALYGQLVDQMTPDYASPLEYKNLQTETDSDGS